VPTHQLTAKGREPTPKEDICLFAQTNFRNQLRRFGIKIDDRRRHMYIIGKTGMGKTTMLENMVLQDIYNGHGIGVVDPHGDFAEKIINYIPQNRINDVVYFNPADVEYPIGFNILEVENEEQKHLVAAGLMAVFKKIWPDVWSARMEYILNNTLLALLDYEGSTLLGINRLLADAKFRKKVLRKLKDPVIKSFWTTEFANYEPRYQKEAVAPIQNKIGQFLSASVIRNMVAQVKSTINVREIMDTNKILIMNLSKGRIGEDNSRLLGGMLITEIQLAAMSRVDMPEEERKDFFLYVDEFQNFATPSFANILSEARKYRLSLIMAHQYVMQLDEIVADAVFGNVGSMVTFRVGAGDAETLEKEYAPTFTIEDIVNLPKFQIFLKLMIDGVASHPFSATTMPPIGSATGSAEKVIRVSRERYGKNRSVIEDKITRWSGMEIDEGDDENEHGNETGGGKGNGKADTQKNDGERQREHTKKAEEKKSKQSDTKKSASTDWSDEQKKAPFQKPADKKGTPSVVQATPFSSKDKDLALEVQHEDIPHSDVVFAEEKGVSDHPLVHLADLLPKQKNEQKPNESVLSEPDDTVSVFEKKEKSFVDEVSSLSDEKTMDTFALAPVRHAEGVTDIQGMDGQPQKKKRKRNRKKKGSSTNIDTSAPRSVSQQESHPRASLNNTLAESDATDPFVKGGAVAITKDAPKKMTQNQVVRFDVEEDDDAWRGDV